MDRYHIRLLFLGTVVALAVAIVVIVVRSNKSHDLVLKVEPIAMSDEITVYAGGAVVNPGLYTLPAHARIASLIDRAGLLATADKATLQMAAELHDGQQVIVPARSTTATAAELVKSGTPGAVSSGPININTATLEQLETLPGIGPALAQRIIDYRVEHGPFESLDDVANVSGVSSRMVDDFRTSATVGP